ncbi:DUF1524 domain-containing protein [Streptomyces sp. NPDC001621]|uniref:GmrSD restriction endonuclease domain-containing protein n=1 Tax=Streptomyces sp. NPDC001621 TaxID=3364594 RepID=UPI0036ACFFBE
MLRQAVLARDGKDVKDKPSSCQPESGSWYSAYDDTTVTEVAKATIDHMVPLAEAWRSGADTWTPEQRKAFGNDLKDSQLLIASESSNTSKSDSGPADWKPTNHAFWCVYAKDYTHIKSVWKLTTMSAPVPLPAYEPPSPGERERRIQAQPPASSPDPGTGGCVPSRSSTVRGSVRWWEIQMRQSTRPRHRRGRAHRARPRATDLHVLALSGAHPRGSRDQADMHRDDCSAAARLGRVQLRASGEGFISVLLVGAG